MNKVVIYQIKDIEKTPYTFRDFDQDHFSLDDYKVVAKAKMELTGSLRNKLEQVFTSGNVGQIRKDNPTNMHSISVSDIIELDGKKYYINGCGFHEIVETYPDKCAICGTELNFTSDRWDDYIGGFVCDPCTVKINAY